MPLDAPPPRTSRFGSPLVLSRVHWVRPELVVEVKFLTWTQEGLLRQVIYQGLREDKPAAHVRRSPLDGALRHPEPTLAKGKPATHAHRLAVPKENILRLLADAVVPTRDELAAYWRSITNRALNHLGRRPAEARPQRARDDLLPHGSAFPDPPAVHQLRIEKRESGEGTRMWVDDLDGLLGRVEMRVVEIHPWGAKTCWYSTTIQVKASMGLCRRDSLSATRSACPRGVRFLAKNNGRQGLHIMVPIEAEMAWNAAHDYTREIAESLAATAPGKYTTSAAFSARPEKLFIDYLRNGRGTTAIGAYSPRARPGFPVAAPVTWRDLEHKLVLVNTDGPSASAGDAGDQAKITEWLTTTTPCHPKFGMGRSAVCNDFGNNIPQPHRSG